MREWQDLYGQLRQAAADLGITPAPAAVTSPPAASPPAAQGGRQVMSGPADEAAPGARQAAEPGRQLIPAGLADRVHMSLLAGLLSHIGMRDTDQKPRGKRRPLAEFAGARGARFAIFPDSSLARKPPPWVVVGRARRDLAAVGPDRGPDRAGMGRATGRAPGAAQLQRAALGRPPRRGDGPEKVTLYGLPIVTARKVGYARVDPAAARDLFIRHALVEGDWQTQHRSSTATGNCSPTPRNWSAGPGGAASSWTITALYDFYDQRIPAAGDFGAAFRQLVEEGPGRRRPACWTLTGPTWPARGAPGDQPADYPDPLGGRSRCRTSSRRVSRATA